MLTEVAVRHSLRSPENTDQRAPADSGLDGKLEDFRHEGSLRPNPIRDKPVTKWFLVGDLWCAQS